jgi:hypothetical protein
MLLGLLPDANFEASCDASENTKCDDLAGFTSLAAFPALPGLP